jgi:hypothetical protein
MKYIVALVLGLLSGAALFGLGLVYSPFITETGMSPLTVTDAEVITLNYANAPADTLVFTNNGESVQQTNPEKVQQLWEAPIRKTSAMAVVLRDGRNQVAGVGIKFSSDSESTRLLRGEAIVDSVWYLYLPQHGSMFVRQSENYWPFLSEVAFPAWRSSGNSWRGSWFGDLTAGPGALGTAAISGGAGRVEGLEMIGVESLSVRAFSADTGTLAADGRMIIELPEAQDDAPLEPDES